MNKLGEKTENKKKTQRIRKEDEKAAEFNLININKEGKTEKIREQ